MGVLELERGSFGETPVIHFSFYEEDDAAKLDNCSLVNHQITWYATGPISVAGVVLNILALLVWSDSRKYESIVFLFKVQAVIDLVYIVLFNVWWYSLVGSLFADVMAGLVFGSQNMLVNVRLLIAVWRWIAVCRTEHSQKLLSRFRSRLAVGIVASYSYVVEIVKYELAANVDDKQAIAIVSVVLSNLLLSAPILLMVVLMVCLICALRETSPEKVSPETSSTGDIHFHGRCLYSREKLRRLTCCIIAVSISTFLAYPLVGVVTAYFKLTSNPDLQCAKRTAFGVSNLLYVINSTIPFFFYFLFTLKFRKMFMLKFITFYTGTYSSKMANDTDRVSENCLPSTVEFSSKAQHSTHFRHSLVVLSEDGILTICKAASPSREEVKETGRKKVSDTRRHSPATSPDRHAKSLHQ